MYRIEYSPDAVGQLRLLNVRRQRMLVNAVEKQLKFEPRVQTRNRKPMRPNALAPWELRIGDLRVYYDVNDEPDRAVLVRAIGRKVRNRVLIGGAEFEL